VSTARYKIAMTCPKTMFNTVKGVFPLIPLRFSTGLIQQTDVIESTRGSFALSRTICRKAKGGLIQTSPTAARSLSFQKASGTVTQIVLPWQCSSKPSEPHRLSGPARRTHFYCNPFSWRRGLKRNSVEFRRKSWRLPLRGFVCRGLCHLRRPTP